MMHVYMILNPWHTSYLSRVHGSYPWRKICHVEKFQISIHLSWGEIWNFSPLIMWRQSRFLHITDMDKFEISLHMSCGDNSDFSTSFVAFSLFCCKITPFLQFTLFCREICFVAIYAFLRGEKLSQKLCPWRKNDKYQVCFWVLLSTLRFFGVLLGTLRYF